MKLCDNWQGHIGIPNVVEFPNYMLLQGNYHDKSTLTPIFLKHWNLNAGKHAYPQALQMMLREWIRPTISDMSNIGSIYNQNGNPIPQQIWSSKYATEIIFTTIHRDYALNYPTFYRYDYVNDVSVRKLPITASTTYDNFIIFDEDDTNVFGFWIIDTGTVTTTALSYLAKDNATAPTTISTVSIAAGTMVFLYSTTTYDWFYLTDGAVASKGVGKLYYLSKAAKTATLAQTVGAKDTRGCQQIPTRVFEDGTNTKYSYKFGTLTDYYICNRLIFDPVAMTSSNTSVTINWGAYAPATEAPLFATSASYMICHAFKIGNSFIGYAICENINSVAETNTSAFNLYLFEKNASNPDQITYLSKIACSQRLRGVFNINDDFTKIVLIYDGSGEFYQWDNTNKIYTKVWTIPYPIYSIGVDSLGRIWVVNSFLETYLYTDYTPARVSIGSELSSYSWTGTIINSYITVDAYNINGSRIVAKINVIVNGDTTFSDGTKQKSITTSSSASTQVPIIINGPSVTRMSASIEMA